MRNRPPMNNASVIGAAVLTTTILVAVMMTTAVPRSAKATTDMARQLVSHALNAIQQCPR